MGTELNVTFSLSGHFSAQVEGYFKIKLIAQKGVNPNRKGEVDSRTPKELLDIIKQKGSEIQEALAVLRV